jgi:hypothetical protein
MIDAQYRFNQCNSFREEHISVFLTLNPMGKCSNAFISETTNMIKAKLYMNVHWMVKHFSHRVQC